jgi:predicted phage terminase large subunit-like protein
MSEPSLVKGWKIQPSTQSRETEQQERERIAQLEQQRRERRERAERDPEFFCSYYLAESFQHPRTQDPTGLAPWQREVLDLSEGPEPNAFAAPRGHGKTTLLSFALTLRDLLRQKSRFTVYISSTFAAACDRINEIKTELETNERIREDYGDLLAKGSGTKAQAADLILSNGTRIVARGSLQAIRGLKNRQHRPDRIILDDVDKDEESASTERIEKRLRWFKKQVMGLQGAGGCKLIVVGNIIARRTLLTETLRNPAFISRVYKAIQDDGTPLMPALWTLQALHAIRDTIGTDSFLCEYQNTPPALGARPFRPEWLQHRWDRNRLLEADPQTIISLDLSKGKTERSDFQAFVAIRRDSQGNVFILRADLDRRTRRELALRALTFSEAIGLDSIVSFVVESNGFQEWFAQELKEQSAAKGYDLPIVEQNNTLAKFDRISKISPIAEGARLLFPPLELEDESIRLLRTQLEEFPDSRHDDGPDALAMAVEESARLRRSTSSRVIPWRPQNNDTDPDEHQRQKELLLRTKP